MNSMQETYETKCSRFEKTQRGEVADRVPIYGLVDGWAFSYAGYTAKEIFEDDNKHIESFVKVAEDFYWDAMFTSFTSKAMNYVNALGGGIYKDKDTMQVETGIANVMEPEEYDQLIADPYAFFRNVIAPRKFALMRKDYSEEKQVEFNKAVDLFLRFRKSSAESVAIFTEKIGMPLSRRGAFTHPIDILLDFLRDFSGTMMDVKRRPDKMAEAADAMVPMTLELVNAAAPEPMPGKSVFNPLHIPPFLRPKEFEKVYWPSFKKIIESLSEKGHIINCYFERDYSHLYDFLADLPKNSVFGLFENDDIRVVKEKLGKNMCIGGGMEVYTLKNGTKQECLDMAKALIDDCAPGGNYIFTTNNILISPGDVNPENLKAVNEFVHEYAVYQ